MTQKETANAKPDMTKYSISHLQMFDSSSAAALAARPHVASDLSTATDSLSAMFPVANDAGALFNLSGKSIVSA